MYSVKLLNKISKAGLANLGDGVAITEEHADAIIVRSADMLSYELDKKLLAIARAGAGYNNIPVDRCSEAGVCVFNTPGANANAVRELAICSLFLASRRIVDAVNWCGTLAGDPEAAEKVEKGKSQFAGPEIAGKTLGILGLGKIGVLVANAAVDLGMEVLGYDPYLSVDSAWGLARRVKKAASYEEIYKNCDYLSIHVPLNPETKGMINAAAIAQMKDGVRIINLARGGLVANADLLPALASGKVARYVTDFPDAEVIGVPNIIALPHLGSSTPESEENCAAMAAAQIADYLRDGTIRNSVNLPNFEAERAGMTRIAIINRNTPNMLGQITSALAAAGINIEHMFNRAKKDYAYTVVDTSVAPSDACVAGLCAIGGVLRVRVID
ncbi:MAG: phosphoglycerate dehydrogenase [Clostridiaceae bacterium]|nr:phosphoglycerate dehydrogenase [Clostridiaceae bacterium]